MSQEEWRALRYAVMQRRDSLDRLLAAIDWALVVGALDDPVPLFSSQTVTGGGQAQPSGAPAWLAESAVVDDGIQQGSGLRGDPAVPGTVNSEARETK